MANTAPNMDRRDRLRRALRKVKPGDKWTLTEIAIVWGTTKQRFITVRKSIEDEFGFPPHEKAKSGNDHLFEAKPALEAMLAYETRNDVVKKDRQQRLSRMVEGTKKPVAESFAMPARELLEVNRLAREVEEREIQQRELISFAEVQRTVGIAFSKISTFINELPSILDPNGELPAEITARLDAKARDALLSLHAEIKGLLTQDVERQPIAGARGKAGRARRPGASRQRK